LKPLGDDLDLDARSSQRQCARETADAGADDENTTAVLTSKTVDGAHA
jgi:hypothetical protein